MNRFGHAVGWYRVTNYRLLPARAFLWRDQKAIDLGLAVYEEDGACRLNDKDQIVGTLWSSNQVDRVFLIDHDRTILLPKMNLVSGINNRGSIIGSTREDCVMLDHGKMLPIRNTSDSIKPVATVNAINDRGDVVGAVSGSDNGPLEAFVWRRGKLSFMPGSEFESKAFGSHP